MLRDPVAEDPFLLSPSPLLALLHCPYPSAGDARDREGMAALAVALSVSLRFASSSP